MVTSEDGKRSDALIRADTPDRGRGFNLFGALLTASGLRALSRGVARIRGGDARDNTADVEAFCLKCRVKTMIKGGVLGTLTNGTGVMRGECSTCGARVSRIMKRQ
jgi:hypothetical protein